MPAIAAVVLACVGFAGMILSSTRSTDHETTTVAGPARDSKAETAVGAPTAPVGDLGDVPDAATLRARALGVAPVSASAAGGSSLARTDSAPPAAAGEASAQSSATSAGAAVSSGAASGGAGGTGSLNAAPSGGSAVGGAGGAAANIVPNAIGTRPCEQQARSREPGLGPVTYFATARWGAVPAYVLGFSTGPNVTLVMLAQAGCTEILRSAGP
jgi:hypothetical protein